MHADTTALTEPQSFAFRTLCCCRKQESSQGGVDSNPMQSMFFPHHLLNTDRRRYHANPGSYQPLSWSTEVTDHQDRASSIFCLLHQIFGHTNTVRPSSSPSTPIPRVPSGWIQNILHPLPPQLLEPFMRSPMTLIHTLLNIPTQKSITTRLLRLQQMHDAARAGH